MNTAISILHSVKPSPGDKKAIDAAFAGIALVNTIGREFETPNQYGEGGHYLAAKIEEAAQRFLAAPTVENLEAVHDAEIRRQDALKTKTSVVDSLMRLHEKHVSSLAPIAAKLAEAAEAQFDATVVSRRNALADDAMGAAEGEGLDLLVAKVKTEFVNLRGQAEQRPLEFFADHQF